MEDNEVINEEQFTKELISLAASLLVQGKPALDYLLSSKRIEDWPAHLRKDMYSKMKLEPVQMYRRIKSGT